ncbi:MAG TPA: hypothetical protein VLS27_17200 [Gammaproteobacteria bacterium]|nr:hypothetical protein [Gammaproteobacteria bacterium]
MDENQCPPPFFAPAIPPSAGMTMAWQRRMDEHPVPGADFRRFVECQRFRLIPDREAVSGINRVSPPRPSIGFAKNIADARSKGFRIGMLRV